MRTTTGNVRVYDFGFAHLDTSIRVEVANGEVEVRATRDTFSHTRRQAFLRALASEGFIGEQHLSSLAVSYDDNSGIRWVVDDSWIDRPHELSPRGRTFRIRLLVGLFGLWLVALLVLRAGK
jgi:hypothetical protein